VGGQDEFGYFAPSKNGQLQYHSLITSLPDTERDFADVWDIAYYKNEVFFRTSRRIFRLTNNRISIAHAPSGWSYVGECKGKLYAHDIKTGLMAFESEQWKALPSGSLTNVEVTAILPIKNAIIITTLKNGVYNYSNTGTTKIITPATIAIEKDRIYTATAINNEWIGLGTTNAGVHIIDEEL
jgi:hypothetical protein